PLILLLLFKGPVWGFAALIFGATALSAVEFFNMSHPRDEVARVFGVLLTMTVSAVFYFSSADPRALVTVLVGLPLLSIVFALFRLGDIHTAAARMSATTFGPLWLSLLIFLAMLRDQQGELGPGYVLMTLMFAWFADTGGYFAGRYFGKHKLYEAVSPK